MSDSKLCMVYVLELENNKFYVGLSENVNNRLANHFNGGASVWTKLHKPIKLVECVIGDSLLEKSKTLEYMSKFGWQNVRGYCWSMTNLQKPPKELVENLEKDNLSITDDNSYVYALELSDGKYYIGCERKDVNTVDRHMSGNGTPWTTQHKPISVIEKFVGEKKDEKLLTLLYMKKFGYQNVRGYAWSQINMKNPPKDLASFDISSYGNM